MPSESRLPLPVLSRLNWVLVAFYLVSFVSVSMLGIVRSATCRGLSSGGFSGFATVGVVVDTESILDIHTALRKYV